MATTLEDAIIRIRTMGAEQTIRTVGEVDRIVARLGGTVSTVGKVSLEGIHLPALLALNAIDELGAGLMGLVRVLGAFSGIGIAAQFHQLEVGFAGLLGDSEQAVRLLKELRRVGVETPFETAELIQFARGLLGAGFGAETLAENLRTITDTVAALGLGTEAVGRLALVLGQIAASIRLQGDELRQLSELGIRLPDIVQAATGRRMGVQEAREFLQSMTGQEAAETILRGLRGRFGGMGRKLATETAQGIVQNIVESMKLAIEPTGRILLAILLPVGRGLLTVVSGFSKLNEMTGGAAGLAALTFLLVKGWRLVMTTVWGVIGALRTLNATLQQLAASAGAAATGTAAAAAGSTATSAAGAAAAAGFGLGALGRMGGLRGILRWIWNIVRRFRIGIAAIALGLGIEALANWLEGRSRRASQVGGFLREAESYGGIGAAAGAALGSVIPGLGTGFGAAIGAAIGVLIAEIKALVGLFSPPAKAAAKAQSQTEQAATKLSKAADSLQEAAKIIAGGRRARRVVSDLEVEYAVARLAALGVG